LNRFTPLSIAVWFMDDGGIQDCGKKDKDGLRKQVITRIYTCSFSIQECEIIVQWFKVVWGIETKLKVQRKKNGKEYPYIRINTTNTRKLIEIIKPYVIDSMKYKIDMILTRQPLMPKTGETQLR
jgi:hypothetical protein